MCYIINKNTNYILNHNNDIKIIENNRIIDNESNDLKIIKDSCIYYGSSYKGRIEGSKSFINSRYKLPIIISEKNKLIFFNVKKSSNNISIWFNYNSISNYDKHKYGVKIIFNNNKTEYFTISYPIFNNQMLKCSRMWLVYLSR